MSSSSNKGRSEAALRYFAARRGAIESALESLSASRGAGESISRIVEFCLRGKMIRGCLVFLGAEAARGSALATAKVERIAGIAAAMELFQAGLLAHDDIMDRDETRRGAPTIHARYATEAEARSAKALACETGAAPRMAADASHVGESLAICLGDLCYFEAYAELARALSGNPREGEILALCSAILSEVAVAQMDDVRWGASEAEPSEEDILAMYRSKTARYTFSLPLAVGALAASSREASGGVANGGAADLAGPLTELGERLGILFQIRDDELGLFGDEASTGKGLGSDLREGKKTLFRARLLAAAPQVELPRLKRLFGGGVEVGSEDLDYVRRVSEELGVSRSIAELSRKAEEDARTIVAGLPGLGTEAAEALEGLIEYVTHREK